MTSNKFTIFQRRLAGLFWFFVCKYTSKAPYDTPDLVGYSQEVPAIPKVSAIANLA